VTLSECSVLVGGALSLLMVVFHTRFSRIFDWENDLPKLTPRNRRILYTIHLALLLLFAILGLLSLLYFRELALCRGLAFGLCLLCGLFWLWRTVWQITYFRPGTGRQHARMRVLHRVTIAVFAVLCVAYVVPVVARYLGQN